MRLWFDGEAHELRQQVTVLGRDPAADLPVLSAEVSRRHAFIVALGGERYLLMDFKSANGTRLNGRRVDAAVLRDGDQIDLAGHLLTVEGAHRRRGSLAAGGTFKTLLRLEEARRGAEPANLVDLWNLHQELVADVLPELTAVRLAGGPEDASRLAAAAVTRALGADRGLLFLVDETGALGIRAAHGFREGEGLRRNLHQALVDEAVDNDRLVATRKRFFDEVFAEVGRPAVDVESALAAPMTLCGSAVGAFYVERRAGSPRFGSEQRDLMRFLAQVLGPQLVALLLEEHVRARMEALRIVDVRLGGEGLGSCEVCGEVIGAVARPVVHCTRCETPHHLDCWNFLGHCAIFGCRCEASGEPYEP